MMSLTLTKKSTTPNQKNVFQVQTRILAESFEGLNSSLAQLMGKLWRWLGNQKLLVFGQNPGTTYS